MKSLKFTLFVPTLILLSFLMVVFARHTDHSKTNHRLALEIGLNEPWTVNAAMEGNTLRAFVRVPANSQSPYSAIKLEPKMVGDKLEVTITGLTGDTSAVKSCKGLGCVRANAHHLLRIKGRAGGYGFPTF